MKRNGVDAVRTEEDPRGGVRVSSKKVASRTSLSQRGSVFQTRVFFSFLFFLIRKSRDCLSRFDWRLCVPAFSRTLSSLRDHDRVTINLVMTNSLVGTVIPFHLDAVRGKNRTHVHARGVLRFIKEKNKK